MKPIKLALMVFTIVLISTTTQKAEAQVRVSASISFQNFYDDLSPYGSWMLYPSYGQVWRPNIDGDFRPYLTNGYWNYTNEGWMWMSNYNWGWAPFHYGRWLYDNMYGWLWVPGYEWSPAWVTWGYYDNYYAWAPLMPGINVSIQFDSWRPASIYWNVVDRNYIYDRNIYRRALPRNYENRYVNQIKIINNYGTSTNHGHYYSRGPELNEVQRHTGQSIQPTVINNVRRSSQVSQKGNKVNTYRPSVIQPQPREYRRIDNSNARPVDNSSNIIRTTPSEQRQNIEKIPVYRTPSSTTNRNTNTKRRKRD